jgi:serine/threonine-protein kinase
VSLAPGTRLGPYEITAQIGAGGMGEVYRARDSRIGRDVAIKVAAGEFGERSEREARAVAALNHPNVCTLHDVGPNYLVMELVEGEAPKGPLPLHTALDYARQIADALDAAHEKGIVHRDLKPDNIKVRSDGTVKVLDFGLAKIVEPESAEMIHQNLSHSPTAMAATHAGMILGTAAYMAPEQARGKPVDKRADIWAFGVVLYEMLTGRRAFEGDDVSSILAAVIQSEPRWDGVPARVRRLLESCLEKDPKKRLRDIGDVWQLLDDEPAVPIRTQSGILGWAAAGLLALLAAVALWAPWRDTQALAVQPVLRLDANLGDEVSLVPLAIPTFSSVVISPDGTRLVFVGTIASGPPRLFTRRLSQPDTTELAGTEGARDPFFSRDGNWVAFSIGPELYKVPVDGGGPVRLGEFRIMAGGYWDDEGNLVIGTGGSTTGVLRLPPAGGAGTPILERANGELFHTHPQILPGGKAMLLEVVGTPPSQDNFTVEVASIVDRVRKTLARGVGSPRYLPSGHLVYMKKATMFAVPFDLERMETRGTAVAVLDDVAYDPIANCAQYDVSRTGTLVYRRRVGDSSTTVQWLDATGKREPLLAKSGAYVGTPRVSPDGKRIAIAIQDGSNQDIWVYEPGREAMTRLTSGGGEFFNPVWTRDGQHVVYGLMGGGLRWSRADGAGPPQILLAGTVQLPTAFSRDGMRLAYFQSDVTPQIWSVPIEADSGGLKAGKPDRFLTTKYTDMDGSFSPDGRWLAYASDESGRFEVYVRAFAASGSAGGGRWLISNSGGLSPAWSPNGREVLYRAGDQIMTAGYTVSGDSFVAERPRVWAANARGAGGFDLTPDGKRVAMFVPLATKDAPQRENTVVVVLNFFDELRRRVPIGQ